ncbi:hypothetical protein FQZ97_844380 [compost metagenome]
MPGAQVDHQLAHPAPEQETQRQPGRNRPEHVTHEPLEPLPQRHLGRALVRHQQQAREHEGKGDSVVQAGFSAEGKAHRVGVAGVAHLDQTGQHRISGRKDGGQEQRQSPVQPQGVMSEQGQAEDGAHQYRAGQQPGGAPLRRPKGQAQAQAANEQGDEHRDFHQPFQPMADPAQLIVPEAQSERSDGQAEEQVEGGGGNR